MSQKEAFIAWFRSYSTHPLTSDARANAMVQCRTILATAQNRPPLGTADGSFDQESWTTARDLLNACTTADDLTRKLLEL